jgi:hypothetical protein
VPRLCLSNLLDGLLMHVHVLALHQLKDPSCFSNIIISSWFTRLLAFVTWFHLGGQWIVCEVLPWLLGLTDMVTAASIDSLHFLECYL